MTNNLKTIKMILLDYIKIYSWGGWWTILIISSFPIYFMYSDIRSLGVVGPQTSDYLSIIILAMPIILLAPVISLIEKYTNISEGLNKGMVSLAIILLIFIGIKITPMITLTDKEWNKYSSLWLNINSKKELQEIKKNNILYEKYKEHENCSSEFVFLVLENAWDWPHEGFLDSCNSILSESDYEEIESIERKVWPKPNDFSNIQEYNRAFSAHLDNP